MAALSIAWAIYQNKRPRTTVDILLNNEEAAPRCARLDRLRKLRDCCDEILPLDEKAFSFDSCGLNKLTTTGIVSPLIMDKYIGRLADRLCLDGMICSSDSALLKGKWGEAAIEERYAKAMTPDLMVRDMEMQQCRSRRVLRLPHYGFGRIDNA